MEGIIDPTFADFSSAIVFRINSLYDPEFSVGGHQPLGFDEWSVFYNKYLVLGAKVRADCFATSTTTTISNAIVGIRFDSASSVVTSLTSIIENGRCRWKRMARADSGNATTTVVSKWSARKWWGGKSKMENEIHGAATSADPSKVAYCHVFAGPVSESTSDLGAIRVRVTIDFIALFTDVKNLSSS